MPPHIVALPTSQAGILHPRAEVYIGEFGHTVTFAIAVPIYYALCPQTQPVSGPSCFSCKAVAEDLRKLSARFFAGPSRNFFQVAGVHFDALFK